MMMVSKYENIVHPVEPVMRILMAKMDAVDKTKFSKIETLTSKKPYFFINLVQCEFSSSFAPD